MPLYYSEGTNAHIMYFKMYGEGRRLKKHNSDVDASIEEQYQSKAVQNSNTEQLYRRNTENVRKSTERIGKIKRVKRGETLDDKVAGNGKKTTKSKKAKSKPEKAV